ncbi:uncharacterized protein LOC127556111 [Antechinus flavipes]|uniref:uncharacterized protein LOC127556111 n=1 Tax=Antechinus flavipes TaxID=38775 RepID=UPI002236575A|nr:uncharacterized protein LOC127556111 [Antechinus flavipes]
MVLPRPAGTVSVRRPSCTHSSRPKSVVSIQISQGQFVAAFADRAGATCGSPDDSGLLEGSVPSASPQSSQQTRVCDSCWLSQIAKLTLSCCPPSWTHQHVTRCPIGDHDLLAMGQQPQLEPRPLTRPPALHLDLEASPIAGALGQDVCTGLEAQQTPGECPQVPTGPQMAGGPQAGLAVVEGVGGTALPFCLAWPRLALNFLVSLALALVFTSTGIPEGGTNGQELG